MNGKVCQRGYVVFVLALSMIVICGFTGLVVDAGLGEYVKLQAQAAADSGAKAGALQVAAGQTSSVRSAALQDTANNGFTNGTNNVTVTVNNPPTSGTHAADSSYVEVVVSRVVPTMFMAVLGSTSMTVTARSVGGVGPGGGCVYVTAPSGQGALTVSGSGALYSSCGVVVNSSNSSAMVLSGNGCITAPSIEIAGGYSNSKCSLSSNPTTGVAASPDPLLSVPAPAVGACNYNNVQITSGATLNPGVYCNGITISGQNLAQFNPGTYILLGGGLSVSGGASISGTGITFYNTFDATHTFKPVSVSGGSQTNISAPATGSLAGILFFQDRSVTSTSQNTISGGSGAIFAGSLYFANSPLVYSGGSASAGAPYTIIVANTLTITGNSYFNNDYSSLPSGDPIKANATIVE